MGREKGIREMKESHDLSERLDERPIENGT